MKTSGTEAEDKGVAAVIALRLLKPSNFEGIGGLWPGCLLQRGRLFKKVGGDSFWVSLGFETYVAIGWECSVIQDVGESYFRLGSQSGELEHIKARLQWMKCSGLNSPETDCQEEYQGIPFEVSSVLSLLDCPQRWSS